mmetsp:Transcript_67460/g.154638  ORF Transcript_67460/g.154638 Transcript_67460/m.154638 type:complete len:112 (+) Transcript_67460:635-970(+)
MWTKASGTPRTMTGSKQLAARMFDGVNIPTACIVENMSYFVCECGRRHDIFKRGAGEKLAERFGIDRYFRLPVDPAMGDMGEPFVLTDSILRSDAVASTFASLAQGTVQAV